MSFKLAALCTCEMVIFILEGSDHNPAAFGHGHMDHRKLL